MVYSVRLCIRPSWALLLDTYESATSMPPSCSCDKSSLMLKTFNHPWHSVIVVAQCMALTCRGMVVSVCFSLSTDGLDSASVCLSYSHEFQTNCGLISFR